MADDTQSGLAPTLTKEEAALSERELAAYRFIQKMPRQEFSPDTVARFYALFIQGKPCGEIARLNKGFNLAQIVQMRVENRWDEKRAEYQEGLMREVRNRVQQMTLESIEFVGDLLAVAHKRHGDRLKKYLMSGDPADLGGMDINSLSQYQKVIELFRAVTGQDKKTGADAEPQKHVHLHQHQAVNADPTPVNRKMTVVESRNIIKKAIGK